jgi:hypothetical protein
MTSAGPCSCSHAQDSPKIVILRLSDIKRGDAVPGCEPDAEAVRSRGIAGVDHQHTAGDVAAALAEQMVHHARNVVGLGEPP